MAEEMTNFEELLEKVEELPETDQEKISFFVNGYIAAAKANAV